MQKLLTFSRTLCHELRGVSWVKADDKAKQFWVQAKNCRPCKLQDTRFQVFMYYKSSWQWKLISCIGVSKIDSLRIAWLLDCLILVFWIILVCLCIGMTRSSCFHLSQPHKLNQTVPRSGMFHEYMWLILHLGRPEGSRYSAGKVGTATDVKPAFMRTWKGGSYCIGENVDCSGARYTVERWGKLILLMLMSVDFDAFCSRFWPSLWCNMS